MSSGPATLVGVELDTAIAAKWCSKHKIPELSPEAPLVGLSELSRILPAIHEAPDIPPPEVRVYYQSMKFILRVAEEQAKFPRMVKFQQRYVKSHTVFYKSR